MTYDECVRVIEKAEKEGATELGLSDEGLEKLPPEIARLTQLSSLNLGGNQLSDLPESLESLTRLTQLTSLDLGGNQFGELPESVTRLSQLTSLDLRSNQLSELPESLTRLTQLTSLDLGDNQFSELPESLTRLTQLTTLNLYNNQLSELPESLGRLIQLTYLRLDKNQLSELPKCLTRLSQLNHLYVDENQLTAVPHFLTKLRNLKGLDLRANKRLPIPPEILKDWEDAPAILRYIEQIAGKEAKRPLNEAKMLLVGEGLVGKTSLVDMLLTGRADRKRKQTDGVEIRRWDVRPISREGAPADNDTVQLNIWDFGGQEIMHATHQFFLTKRSLYLVVLNAREGEIRGRLDYWLKIIDSFGGDSPVIVVVNRGDEHRLELNRADLQRKYPDRIRGFIETACFGDIKGEPGRNGIAELKILIAREVYRLDHIRDPLLARWFEVKRQLEEMKVNYIPESDYVAMCAGQGIDHKGDQELLLGYLNDLGVVLTFRDDRRLRDTNILNPVWVTDGIYRILNSPLVFQSKGVLRREVLGEILDPAEYPPDRYDFLIGMMRRFELCFAFEGREDEYLIPDLLSKEAPFLDWDEETALNWEFHYDVLPSSVISRFMVRTSRYLPTEGTATWRTGVVIEVEGCKARVRADNEAAIVTVSILGQEPARHRALAVIRSEFEHIHDTISGIKAEEKVPVPGHDAKPVSYQHLLELRKKGVREFLPEGGEELVGVAWLLEGIEELADPDRRGLEKQGVGRRGRRGREWEDEAEEVAAPVTRGQSVGAGGAAVAPAREPVAARAAVPEEPSGWRSVGPILTAYLVILGSLAVTAVYVSREGSSWLFVPVSIAMVLMVVIVLAAQMTRDKTIGEKSFVKVMGMAFKRLTLLRGTGQGDGSE